MTPKKLILHRETLAHLDEAASALVAAGTRVAPTLHATCTCALSCRICPTAAHSCGHVCPTVTV